MNFIYLMIPAALLVVSVVVSVILVKRGTSVKRAMAIHILSLIVIATLSLMLPFGAAADTADENVRTTAAQTTGSADQTASNGLKYIGAALAVGLAGVGGGIAVAAGAPAAIGANVEDPKSFGKSIIFVALGEGFGLYGLLIGILCLVL